MPSLSVDEVKDATTAYLRWLGAQVKVTGIPGATVSVLHRGRTIAKGAVDTIRTGEESLHPDDRFDVASVAKFVAALTAYRLHKLGLIHLHQPIGPGIDAWMMAKHRAEQRSRSRPSHSDYMSEMRFDPPMSRELSSRHWATPMLMDLVRLSSIRDRTLYQLFTHTAGLSRNGHSGDHFTIGTLAGTR